MRQYTKDDLPKDISYRKDVIVIRVIHKSGVTVDIPVYDFYYQNGSYVWEAASKQISPIALSASGIDAVYRVGHFPAEGRKYHEL